MSIKDMTVILMYFAHTACYWRFQMKPEHSSLTANDEYITYHSYSS